MVDYRRRVLDDALDELQPHLRALSIHGPKGVGKTATAMQRAVSVIDLSLPAQREIVAADPSILTRSPGPVLVDEWQRLPEVWDQVRHAVDAGSPPGHFIIAGSSAPRGAVVHSGAGRIVPMRMRPLSMAERGIETPTVSLAALLAGNRDVGGTTGLRLADYVEEIVASGFPAIRGLPPRVRRAELDAYLENVVQREFSEQGYPVRRPAVLRAWLAAYAAATSSTAAYSKILDAATAGLANKPAKETTIAYRDALSSLWLLDDLPPWIPGRNHLDRLGQSARHQLADPALAARLLGLDAAALLRAEQGNTNLSEGTILGALFEHLVALSVHTYAEAAEARVSHLRTRNSDHEVDLIVQQADGRVLGMEVKLADRVEDADTRHLHWLRDRIGEDLIDSVVIYAGEHAYRRRDDVAVVPLALVGP
ncbi:ATP-binding protein [Actinoplanes sp. NPDC051343]|uniref:ATP-binding protein n=1 Tax=Actinoplanes sp. NPDC051343 TaxID=3363906 RepID=UPI00378B77A6